ncbi:MAG: hypothetical protein ACLSHC_14700 [Bilophila wadsworthia]
MFPATATWRGCGHSAAGAHLAQRGRLLGVVLTHGTKTTSGGSGWFFIKGLKVYGSP